MVLLPTETRLEPSTALQLLQRSKRERLCVCVSVYVLWEGVKLGGQIWTSLNIRHCCTLPPTAPSMRNTAASLVFSPGSPPSSSVPTLARSSRALTRPRLSSLMEQNSVSPACWEVLSWCLCYISDSATVTIATVF